MKKVKMIYPSSAGPWLCYIPMHDVAPSAVRMADAIEAISCTINFAVSFFVIVLHYIIFKFYHFYNFYIV